MSKPKSENATLSITPQELIGYLKGILEPIEHEQGHEFQCAFCKSTEWVIEPLPEDVSRPMLVAHPIPDTKNLANWYFPMRCLNCGYTMFLMQQ